MKIKWNWGTKILISMLFFMTMMIGFMVATFMHDVNLVEDDYYSKELKYQEQIDKESNTEMLDEKISIENVKDFLIIAFPDGFAREKINGEILIYRPSSSKLDIEIPIELDSENAISIPTHDLLKGKYVVKIDYEYLGKSYFQKKSVFIKM